jgi:hypothetical protein|tara:strand:+ start:22679 stop:23029 length:351 start_codon:yes stop_codon:yes gene_type:complete
MSRLDIILSAILTLSAILNIGLLVYARAAIIRIVAVSEELGDLQRMVDSFAHHLKAVYELDSFYGDETLRRLLEHAISFNEQMDTFEYIISLTEDGVDHEVEEIIYDDETEEENQT